MKKLLFTLILTTICGISAFAYDFSAVCESGQTLFYNITSNVEPYTVEVTRENTTEPYYTTYPEGNLAIPESVSFNAVTYSVTNIGDSAFYGCSGLSGILTFPNSVTSIGNEAFYNCSGLTSIIIPNSVTNIGDRAFCGCSGLTGTLTIHKYITQIGSHAFTNCGMTTVNFNAINCQAGGFLFSGSSSFTTLNIGDSVTQLYSAEFGNCTNLSTVNYNAINCTIGGVAILAHVFYNCSSLAVLNIGENVTNIPNYAFSGCSGLSTINYNATNCAQFGNNNGISGNTHITTLTIGENVQTIPNSAFSGCSGLSGALTIPNSVTSIGGSAFKNCSGLTSINIPDLVTEIESETFSGCFGLAGTLTIPNSVTSIGSSAFSGCSGLSSVVIPNSVTSIGNSAFSNCSGLNTVNFNATNCTTMGSYSYPVFQNSNANAIINIGEGVTTIPDEAFSGLLGNDILIIPNSVTSIGVDAFYGCSGLTSVTIGNSVTSIGNFAFSGCSGLTSVTIPNSVTSIGYGAFYCENLTTVNFNAINCTNMGSTEDPVFPPSMEIFNIGENVANIPIATLAFYIGLTTIISNANIPPLADNFSFFEISNNIPVYVPCGTVQAYQNSEGWSIFTNIYAHQDAVFPFTAEVQSYNPEFGSVEITHNPDCNEPTFSVQTTPIEHYHFVSWSDGCTESAHSIVVTQDTLLVATFAIDQHTLFLNSDSEIMGGVTGFGTYVYNSFHEITAVPNYGYHFTHWNDGNTDNPRMVNVLSDTLFTAYFDNNEYLLTVESDSSVMGMVEGGDTYRYLDASTITAVPNYGYHFTQWNDGVTENPRMVNVLSDTLFTAYFDNNDYMLTAETSDWIMGSVEGGDTYRYLDVATITAVPNYGYHFTEWNDGVTDNPRMVNVLSDTLFTAYFDNNEYNIVAESANEDMGTVDGGSTYRYLDEAILNANASDGYIFVRWNDGNTENPRFVTVERDSTFTATFGILNEMTITDCNNYDLGGGYNFHETGTHYGFFTNAEGVDSVVRLDLTIEQPIETSIRVVATNENNRNVVTWNPVSNNTMLGYLVYRQDAYGQYEVVDTVAIDAECLWTDEVSNTAVRPYRYAVATYDSCGNISAMSDSHRTIHLQISLGQGNSRNLLWTDYEGINFSTYRVYRGTSIDDMEMIMEMSRENHTYTDFDVQHDYFYQIEIVQGMKSVVISRSNIVSTNPGGITDIEGIDISEIDLFPNPVTDILNITSSEPISEIEIVNVMGQVVRRVEVNSDNAVCNVEDLKSGVYVVRIRTLRQAQGSVISQRKFVKE